MRHQTRGIFMLSLTAFIWGTAFVAQSVSMDYMGPFTFNSARFLIGGFVLLPVIFWMNRSSSEKEDRRQIEASKNSSSTLIKGGIYCGLALFIGAAFQQLGIIGTTVGKAGFISTLYVVMVPVLGLFFGKKVSKIIWLCIFLAMIGMYLLCINESLSLSRGDFLVLISAFCFSIHILVIDHFSPLVDGVKLSCIQFFTCGILSGIVALALESPEFFHLSNGWKALLYSGVLSCGVAYTLQVVGQKYVMPVIASLILSLESVFAVFSGWIILDEMLTAKEIWGCVLIFGAILLAQAPDLWKKKERMD